MRERPGPPSCCSALRGVQINTTRHRRVHAAATRWARRANIPVRAPCACSLCAQFVCGAEAQKSRVVWRGWRTREAEVEPERVLRLLVLVIDLAVAKHRRRPPLAQFDVDQAPILRLLLRLLLRHARPQTKPFWLLGQLWQHHRRLLFFRFHRCLCSVHGSAARDSLGVQLDASFSEPVGDRNGSLGLDRPERHFLRADSPRWLGPFDAQGSHFTTTRGD